MKNINIKTSLAGMILKYLMKKIKTRTTDVIAETGQGYLRRIIIWLIM